MHLSFFQIFAENVMLLSWNIINLIPWGPQPQKYKKPACFMDIIIRWWGLKRLTLFSCICNFSGYAMETGTSCPSQTTIIIKETILLQAIINSDYLNTNVYSDLISHVVKAICEHKHVVLSLTPLRLSQTLQPKICELAEQWKIANGRGGRLKQEFLEDVQGRRPWTFLVFADDFEKVEDFERIQKEWEDFEVHWKTGISGKYNVTWIGVARLRLLSWTTLKEHSPIFSTCFPTFGDFGIIRKFIFFP